MEDVPEPVDGRCPFLSLALAFAQPFKEINLGGREEVQSGEGSEPRTQVGSEERSRCRSCAADGTGTEGSRGLL